MDDLSQKLESLKLEALAAIQSAHNETTLEAARVQYLGKSGTLASLGEEMRNVPKEMRPIIGKTLNEVRGAVTGALESRKTEVEALKDQEALRLVDVTLPGIRAPFGSIHPLSQVQDRVVSIFRRMGFVLADGPDVETEWHCFDALNTPPDHPARNDTDTFYFADGRLLRTQTSTVQILTMETQAPPVRIIAPGAAYRRDETDATHAAQFNQMEGLYVAEGVSLADLKGTVEFFFRQLLGEGTAVRFRPHFFPFTEPSFEIDVSSQKLKDGAWIEVAGCGMVDPAVFESVNRSRGDNAFDPERVSGFAFGFGIDRIAMILKSVPDIRLFSENDIRFLAGFGV